MLISIDSMSMLFSTRKIQIMMLSYFGHKIWNSVNIPDSFGEENLKASALRLLDPISTMALFFISTSLSKIFQ